MNECIDCAYHCKKPGYDPLCCIKPEPIYRPGDYPACKEFKKPEVEGE